MPDTFLGHIFLLQFEYLINILNLGDGGGTAAIYPPPQICFHQDENMFHIIIFYNNFLSLLQFDKV